MPKHGEMMGSPIASDPQYSTHEQLSRTLDMLEMATEVVGLGLRNSVWQVLPAGIKMDYNYSRWMYIQRGEPTEAQGTTH